VRTSMENIELQIQMMMGNSRAPRRIRLTHRLHRNVVAEGKATAAAAPVRIGRQTRCVASLAKVSAATCSSTYNVNLYFRTRPPRQRVSWRYKM
jgi:hypothetical protein